MKLNQKLRKFVASMLLGVGIVPLATNFSLATVKAADTIIVNTPAAVYDKQGQLTGETIPAGKVVKTTGLENIADQIYYNLGDGKYILSTTVLARDAVPTATSNGAASSKQIPKLKIIKKSYVYNNKGKRTKHKALKKGGIYQFKGSKVIRGKKYYKLSKKRYIRANNAQLSTTVSSINSIQTDK